MPNFEAIGDVSRTLEQFLTNELLALAPPNPAPVAQLHDLVTPPSGTPPVLTLFLYDIVEDGSARNRPLVRTPVQTAGHQRVVSKKPPAALILRYMMTAWAGDRVTEHRIMGRVIQAFYERATLSGPLLLNSLADTTEALHMTLSPIALDDRARVWEAIQKTYRLSINYEVRVVHIDSEYSRSLPAVTEQLVQPALVEGSP